MNRAQQKSSKHVGSFLKDVFGLILFILMSAPFVSAGELKRHEFAEPHMGTLFRVVFYAPDDVTAMKAQRAAFDRIEELNNVMSDYKDDSELMKLVHAAGTPPWKISDDLFNVLKISKEAAIKSDGAFDITLGPVIRLWRRARRVHALPDKDKLADAMKLVGVDKLILDEKEHTARITTPGVILDLGGIGKGYAADAAQAVFKKMGIEQALVAAGGDITVSKAPPGSDGWTVAIAPLDPATSPKITLLLENQSVSTSGDAEQFVEINGVRYSHIIDPKTGIGLTGHRNVTVVGPNGTTADWMTKVASIQGEKGFKLIDETPGCAAMIVEQRSVGEEVKQSANWKNIRIKSEK